MRLAINPNILRMAWPGLLPIATWILCVLIVAIFGKAAKRRLLKLLLWLFPAFLLQTAYVVYGVLMLSNNPI